MFWPQVQSGSKCYEIAYLCSNPHCDETYGFCYQYKSVPTCYTPNAVFVPSPRLLQAAMLFVSSSLTCPSMIHKMLLVCYQFQSATNKSCVLCPRPQDVTTSVVFLSPISKYTQHMVRQVICFVSPQSQHVTIRNAFVHSIPNLHEKLCLVCRQCQQ